MIGALLCLIGWALAGPLQDGDAAFEAGDHPTALVRWGAALEQARAAEDADAERDILLRMSAAQRELGAVDLAGRVLDAAAGLADDARARADVGVGRGRLAQHVGDLEAAQQHYQEAYRDFRRAEAPRGAANAALNLGGTRLLLGDVVRAREAFEAARTLFDALGDLSGAADAQVNLALVDAREGNLREARTRLELALGTYERLDQTAGQIDVLANLARVEADLGRWEATRGHLDAAQELARARKDVQRQLDLSRQAVPLYLELGQVDRAVKQLDALTSAYREEGRPRDAVEARLNYHSLLASYAGSEPGASEHAMWPRIVDEARATGDPRLLARARVLRARAAAHRRDFTEASKLASKALKSAERLELDEVHWQALYVLGQAARETGDLDAAAEHLNAAVDRLERRRRLLEPGADAAFAHLYDPVYAALADVHLARGETLALLATAERQALADLPPGEGAAPAVDLARREAWLQERLGEEVAARGDTARAEALRREISELRIAFAETVDRLRTEVADLESRVRIAPEDLEALQPELPPGVTVLQPVLLPDRLVLLVFSRDALQAVPVEVSPEELTKTLSRLSRALRAGLRDPAVLDPLADKLGGWLWAPVADHLPADGTVVVSAAGSLRQVPFALLRHDGRYLAEHSAIALITHVGSLRGAPTPLHLDGSGLLLVGNPDGTLPGAEAEVQALAQAHPGAAVLIGQDATRAALLGHMRGRTAVHLATHGRIDATAPARSHLVLAEDDAGESRLGYREIPGLAPFLRDARLVVLSACESGRPVDAADGVVSIQGLAAQFRRAGVETLVASLWKVDDAGTRALMEAFYARLDEGHDAATALAEAQRALMQDEAHATPWVWAAFVVAGDWR